MLSSTKGMEGGPGRKLELSMASDEDEEDDDDESVESCAWLRRQRFEDSKLEELALISLASTSIGPVGSLHIWSFASSSLPWFSEICYEMEFKNRLKLADNKYKNQIYKQMLSNGFA